jgi:predicted ATPase
MEFKSFKSFGAVQPTGVAFHDPGWPGEKVRLGGLSFIIGTNASGKSNIRDGLRFIHGISRGYTIAEIIGAKYVEGGVLQWAGIRGGLRETVTRNGTPTNSKFTLTVRTRLAPEDGGGEATYSIMVDVGDKSRPPIVAGEWLLLASDDRKTFDWKGAVEPGQMEIYLRRRSAKKALGPARRFRNDRPVLSQILELDSDGADEIVEEAQRDCRAFLRTISSVRFLDLDPNSLRRPSIPGQTTLGDKGENLSSVLQAICAEESSKEALIEWTRELTPLDVVDLRFPEVSLEGKIQLQLVEQGGREISAESASDGTLRFLAFAGALLGTEPARFYFFEEIENGIHPNRAHLLVNLLQRSTRKGSIQVVGTTHSPALLNFLDARTLRDASLVYRAGAVSKIRSFADIPALWQVTANTRPGELFGSGWFENVAAFLETEGTQ